MIRRIARAIALPLVDGAIRSLPPDARDYVLRRAAEDLGVATITFEGDLGTFEGAASDHVVHAGYVASRTWAPEFQALARRVFAAGGGTLIDVGANIGLTSIPIAKSHGVTCYAFEPDATNHRLLVRNVEANGAGTLVLPLKLAVMDRDGPFVLERSKDNMGDHRIRVGEGRRGAYDEDARPVTTVEGRRLDTALAGRKLAGPVLLKVDTQGAEARVLGGAAGILASVDRVYCEYWPYGLVRMGDTPARLLEALSGFGYGCVVRPDGVPPLEPMARLAERVQRAIPVDGRSTEHLDLLLSREPTLEVAAPRPARGA
jgi:FkbM family methyltransferase